MNKNITEQNKKNNHFDLDNTFFKMFRSKTGGEKIKMGFSMFKLSSKFIVSSILSSIEKSKSDFPDKHDLKKKIFLRIYSNDFDEFEKERIIDKF